jgi:SOS-response transcriptional repressor LexA
MFNSQALFLTFCGLMTMSELTSNNANLMTVLKALVLSENLTANALAKILNLPTPTINRLMTGEVQDPRASTLCAIADYFDITVDQLLGRTPLPTKLTKTEFGTLMVKPKSSIPIVNMTDTIEHIKTEPRGWLRWKAENNEYNKHLYAVTIKNSLYEPTFPNGAYLIINPDIKALSGDYVLVKFSGDPTAVVKKYISEGSNKYLYPIKSDLKTINFDNSEHTIIGVIVETYRCLRTN